MKVNATTLDLSSCFFKAIKNILLQKLHEINYYQSVRESGREVPFQGMRHKFMAFFAR